MNRQIGENLRKRRLELGLKASDISSKIGVSRATWYRYEKGEVDKISTLMMNDIAKILKTSALDLLGYDYDFYDPQPAPEKPPDAHPTLTEQDIEAIAERVHSYSAPAENAPRTVEARIVSFGMDKLPHEDRERLLAMVSAMYPGMFKDAKEDRK